ncbi:MAG: prephenate dehydrogenase/arogenate dehydrogenase family protein, partial [Agathobaculum sp.]
MFDTVLIAGLGLMGGSMAKAIKTRTLSRVLGWNRTRRTAEQALADGVIDAIATEALYKEADLVIIGLYPQATVDWLLENMPKLKKGCVVVDMVGVKQFMV